MQIVKLDRWQKVRGKKALSTFFFQLEVCQTAGPKDKHLCGLLHQLNKDHHEIEGGIDYAKICWFLSISGNKKGQLEVI